MNKEKMVELSKDEKFVAELAKAQTAEEAQKVFSDYGASVTIEELNALSAAAQKDKTGGELADEDLNDVAGGSDWGVQSMFEPMGSTIRKLLEH